MIHKFRYWDQFNGCYTYSDSFKKLFEFFRKFHFVEEGGNKPVLEQFTGLLDKNGKEIYEGDVLRFFVEDHKLHVEKYNMNPNRWAFVVCFENACHGYKPAIPSLHFEEDLSFCPFWCDEDKELWDLSDVEIIGTIRENQELLQEAW